LPKSPDSPAHERRPNKAFSQHFDSRVAAPTFFYRALGFASAADAYVQTYGEEADLYMTFFLLGRSFELALKSVLSAKGVAPQVLASRKLGHNLEALIHECNIHSIEIVDPTVPDSKWGLSSLNEAYSEKELEYQERGRAGGPHPALLRQLVHFALHQAYVRALGADARSRPLARGTGARAFTLEWRSLYG